MKKDLVKKIKQIIKEVRTSRADIEQAEIDSSIEDLSDLDSDIASAEEEFYFADEEDDFDRRAGESDQLERLGGLERFEESAPPGKKCEKIVKGLKKKFGKDSSAPYAIAWSKHNKGVCEEEAIMQEAIIKQVIKNKLLKEDYYNLMGVPNANPVASNTNGVDATVAIDEEREHWDDDERWPKDDDEGYEDEPGSRADEDDWKYRNVDLDEGFGMDSGDRYFDSGIDDEEDGRWDSIFNKLSDFKKLGKISKFTPEEKEFVRNMSDYERNELASLSMGYLGKDDILSDLVKEDRIDPITGKGASGVQSQVAAKKKAMEKERAAEEKIWADQERISRAKRNKGL